MLPGACDQARAALDELRTGHRAAQAVETGHDGAWQRAQFLALRAELRKRGAFNVAPEPNLAALLDLVALGTVADVVPLTGGSQNVVVRLSIDGRRLVLRRPPPHPRSTCR